MLNWIAAYPVLTGFLALCHLPWIGAIVMIWWRLRQARRVAGHPVTPLAKAPVGKEVVVEGKVASLHLLYSTLRSHPVAWFDWTVQAARLEYDSKKPFQPPRTRWVSHDSGRSTTPFAIEDEQGKRIVLLPSAAEVLTQKGTSWSGPTERPSALATLEPRNFRYSEQYLEAGEACTVVGLLEPRRPEDGPEVCGVIASGGRLPFTIANGSPQRLVRALRTGWIGPTIWGVLFFILAGFLTVFVPMIWRLR